MFKPRRAIYWQVALFVSAIALIAVLSRFFPIVDLVEALRTTVAHWGAWGGACYAVIFAGCNILLLPGGILAFGGGFFFGLWWGFLIVFAGNVVAAAISFASNRWVANRWFRHRLSQNKTLRLIEPAVKREGWKIILLSQLHPLFPTSLLNYLYGLTPIRFGPYMFWTTVGRAPGLFLYTYLGTLGQFGLNLALGRTHPRVVEYWMWGGAFVITALLFILLTRVALNVVRESHDLAAPAEENASSGDELLYHK